MLVLAGYLFACTIALCSASWLIKAFSESKLSEDSGSFNLNYAMGHDDYYKQVNGKDLIPEDNPAAETGDTPTPYFTGTVTTYSGSQNVLTITEVGAQKLFGCSKEEADTVDESGNKKYTAIWVGGRRLVKDKGGNTTFTTTEQIGTYAGTHYYRIVDNTTGQVLFHKYAYTIEPDTLTGAAVLSNAPLFKGDAPTFTVTWTPKNTNNQNVNDRVSHNYAPDIKADFTDDGTISVETCQNTHPFTNQLLIDNVTDENLRNNFDFSKATTTAATFNVYARAYSYSGTSTNTRTYYGSVETALNATQNAGSSTTVVAIPSITYNSTAYTCKHEIYGTLGTDGKRTATVGTNVTLFIPFDGSKNQPTNEDHIHPTVDKYGSGMNVVVDAPDTYRKNRVTLKQGATLTVNGTLTIAATISGGNGGVMISSMVAGDYAELVMEKGTLDENNKLTQDPAKIQVNSGGTVNCYGFIAESAYSASGSDDKPTVTLDSGANMTTVFTIVEHRGGTAFLAMVGSSSDPQPVTTPFNRFYCRSVTSDVIIKKGASLQGYYTLKFTMIIAVYTDGKIPLFSTENNAFFQMKNDTEVRFTFDTSAKYDLYEEDSYGNTLLDADGNPKVKETVYGKNVVISTGSVKINPIEVKVQQTGVTIPISTETVYLPISHYWHIEFYKAASGTNISIPVQNIKILPGGYVKLHEGVTATVKSLAVYDHYDQVPDVAENGYYVYPDLIDENKNPIGGSLIVDGTLVVEGGFGGIAQTSGTGAVLTLASNTATATELNPTNNAAPLSVTLHARGTFKNSAVTATVQELPAKTFSSLQSFWYQSVINLTYYSEGTLNRSDPVHLAAPGLLLSGEYYYTPTHSSVHYAFNDWYTDQSYNNLAKDLTVYGDQTLYAKWSPISYPTNFISTGPAGETLPTIGNITFDVTTPNVVATVTPTDPNGVYNFLGWYTDEGCNTPITNGQISGQELIDLENGYTLYGKWGKETTYTIQYETKDNVYKDLSAGSKVWTPAELEAGTVTLKDMSAYTDAYQNDLTKSHYFRGWKLNGEGEHLTVEDLQELLEEAGDNSVTITLVADWQPKTYSATIPEANNDGNEGYVISFSPSGGVGYKSGTIYFDSLDVIFGTSATSYDQIAKKYDSNQSASKVFVAWKSGETVVTNSNFVSGMTLTPEWTDKVTITITVPDSVASITVGGTTYTAAATIYVPVDTILSVSAAKKNGYKDPTVSVTNGTSVTGGYQFSDTSKTAEITASADSCVAAGTLITLADGTVKKVEDLLETDILLVFDHETGRYTAAPILFIERDGWAEYNVINLRFSDGRVTRLIYEHALFDVTLNKYVYVTEENLTDFVGHEFAVMDGDGIATVTLIEAFVTTEYTGCFSLVTAYHLNYFIDGLFSIPGGIEGLFNIFEYGDGLKYDEEQMKADIEEYGLYTYEDFAEYLPEEFYNAFPAAYFKVSVGKGYVTFEQILQYIEQYLVKNGLM